MERRIIDKRKKEKFMMDDEYLNGQAKLCGWQGTIVYSSLCRHCNINQESFPSIKLMAEQHNVSRPTIIKGIENLEKRKVIEVKKTRTKDGKWLNNVYILIDKSEWDYSQVNVVDTASQVNENTQPSQRRLPDGVNVVDTKETHSEGNTIKETHISEQSSQVNELMDIFSKINPSLNWGNKTTRMACEWLIKKYTLSGAKSMAESVVAVQGRPYAPVATTPYQMKEKLAQFKIYFDSQKNNKNNFIQL